ncbi:MAG: carbohydrate-binding protein [Pseudomonadota bacterium]
MLNNRQKCEKKFENKSSICFSLGMLMLCSFSTFVQAAKTLNFSGYTWNVRDYEGMPGPNKFHADNVWVDDKGFLHLKIARRDNVWTSAELYTTEPLPFGTYQFKILGRPDKLDKNVVFGLFNYSAPSGTNEIDIEFSRWNNDSYPNLNWTVWPAQMLNGNQVSKYPTTIAGDDGYVRDAQTYEMKLAGDQSTHIFTWTQQSVAYEGHNGFVNFNEHKQPFYAWKFAPSDSAQRVPQKPLVVDINLWMFEGKPPVGSTEIEMVVTEFKLFKGETAVNQGNPTAETIPTTSLSNSGVPLFCEENGSRLSDYYKNQPKDAANCRVWKEGDVYALGDKVTFNNAVYTSLHNHKAWNVTKSWSPDTAPQLWSRGGLCTKEDSAPPEISKEPCKKWDADESYIVGEVVSYENAYYVALVSHKALKDIWTPATTLTTWQKVDACTQPVSKKKEWSAVVEGKRPTVEEMRISWYGASEKCKAGTEEECNVFYSKKKKYPVPHDVRTEGKGTAEDPITLAADGKPFPVGTLVYIPQFKKYFVFEDKCAGCVGENYIELFMGPTKSSSNSPALLKCAIDQSTKPANLDKPKTKIMINPETNLEVDQTPIFTEKACAGKPMETVLPNCDGAPPVNQTPTVGGNGGGGAGDSGGGATGDNATATKACIQRTNELRKTKGLPPFAESDELANNAAIGITYDPSHGGIHAHAGVTNVGENMWATSQSGDAAELARSAVDSWWSEGPGEGDAHGHYMNLVGNYTKAGCAVGSSPQWKSNVYMDLK